MRPDNWHVGVILEDGSHDILTSSSGSSPSYIEDVILPLSFPWEDGPVLRRKHLEHVGGQMRSQGPERHYSARLEDNVPNTEHQWWEVELEVWEYPRNAFNSADLHHSDQIRYAHWKSSDLLEAMDQRF